MGRGIGKNKLRSLTLFFVAMLCSYSSLIFAGDPPKAYDQGNFLSSRNKTPISLKFSDSDTEFAQMIFTIVSGPAHGSLKKFVDRRKKLSYPQYKYVRDKGYEGADSFTWKCSDGQSESKEAIYSIKDNQGPAMVSGQSVLVVTNSMINIIRLPYKSSPKRKVVSFTLISAPKHGKLGARPYVKKIGYKKQIVQVGNPVVGRFNSYWVYTPQPNYSGSDLFSWKCTDTKGEDSETVTCRITVKGNSAPKAEDQHIMVKSATRTRIPLSIRDENQDQKHSLSLVKGPSYGKIEHSTQSSVWYYTPDSDKITGGDSFTWSCHDGFDSSNTATTSLSIVPGPPEPYEDTILVSPEKTTFTAPYTGAQGLKLSVKIESKPSHGELKVSGTKFTYTPKANYLGHDSFRWRMTYDMKDGSGLQRTDNIITYLLVKGKGVDWPTFRADAYRSAKTHQKLPKPKDLHLQWLRDLPAPTQAWKGLDGGAGKELTYHIDLSHEPIVMEHTLIVGLNRDGSVRAYDTRSGKELWRRYTDGPIRQAPVAHRLASGKTVVMVPSDDGCMYGFDMRDGRTLWKHRGMPSKRKVNGNRRIVSAWPLRGGPMVWDSKVYFAGGLMPLDGTFIECLDVETGELKWRHDHTDMGDLKLPFNPQGYLVRNSLQDRSFWVPATEWRPRLFSLDASPSEKDLDRVLPLGAATYYVNSGWAVNSRGRGEGVDISNRRVGILVQGRGVWPKTITAGGVFYTGKQPEVNGTVFSVVAADNRLFVMTTDAQLYCFSGKKVNEPTVWERQIKALTKSKNTWGALVKKAMTSHALKGIKGMAYVWGLKDGGSIGELIKQSTLSVVVVDPDPKRVKTLRDALSEADVHGPRVNVIEDVCTKAYLPPYMARLIISEDITRAGYDEGEAFVAELFRCLRPYGGAAWLPSTSRQHKSIEAWVVSAKLQQCEVSREGSCTVLRRVGALPESLDKFSKADERLARRDDVVKGPLGTLWWNFDLPWYSLNINHHDTSGSKPPQPEVLSGKLITMQSLFRSNSRLQLHSPFKLGESIVADVYTGLFSGEKGTHAGSIKKDYRVALGPEISPGEVGVSPSQPRKNKAYGVLERFGSSTSFHSGRFRGLTNHGVSIYSHETGGLNLGMGRLGDQSSRFVIAANGVLDILEPGYCPYSACARALHTPMGLVHVPDAVNWCASSSNRIHAPVEDEAMRNVLLNFGAPHDFMSSDAELWMHQPYRHDPLVNSISYYESDIKPWPPQAYYRHPLRVDAGESQRGVVCSGLLGVEQVRIPVAWPAVASWNDSKLKVDGKLSDSCWDGQNSLLLRRQETVKQSDLENRPLEFRKHGAKTWIRYDDTYLYIACQSDSKRVQSGTWRVILSDEHQLGASGARTYLDLKIKKPGEVKGEICYLYQSLESLAHKQSNLPWSEDWLGEMVDQGKSGSTAEFRISWQSLSRAGLSWDKMLINVIAPNLAHVRNAYKPQLLQAKKEGASGGMAFVPLSFDKRSEGLRQDRLYTVRLHFAEPMASTGIGERVFDVALQGSVLLENFDILKEAGSSKRGVVREFKGISVRDELLVDFKPRGTQETVLCGIEMKAEYLQERNHRPLLDIFPLADKAEATSVIVGKKITFMVRSLTIDPDGDDLTFEWALDGKQIAEGLLPKKTAAGRLWRLSGYAYKAEKADVGIHELSVKANDGRGGVTDFTWKVVVEESKGIYIKKHIAALPASGRTPLQVNFSLRKSAEFEESGLSYLWDFGDGEKSTSLKPDHTFKKGGSYRVWLKVKKEEKVVEWIETTVNVIDSYEAIAPI